MLRHPLHLAPPLMVSLLEWGAFAMYWNSASKEASRAIVSALGSDDPRRFSQWRQQADALIELDQSQETPFTSPTSLD